MENDFGEDGDSASFLPYLWGQPLHKAAASMGSVVGYIFSWTLGLAHCHDIDFIIEDLRTKKVTVESSKMTDEEIKNMKVYADSYKRRSPKRVIY